MPRLELRLGEVAELVHSYREVLLTPLFYRIPTHGPGGTGQVVLLVAPQVVPEDEEPPLRLLGGVVLPPVLSTEPGELCPRVLVTVV